jgi:GT2 family glycosyltransferase
MKKRETWLLILTYKYPQGLARLLKSLEETNYPMNRIKLILNGIDIDAYKEVLSIYETKLNWILEWPHNLGFYRAFNNGLLTIPSNEYVILCNDDVVINNSSWIDELFAEMNELIGVVGIKQKHTYPSGIENIDSRRIMACCLLNPTAVRKVGLFDERYFGYYGDIQYLCQMHAAGFKTQSILTDSIFHEIMKTFEQMHKEGSGWVLNDAWWFYQYLNSSNYEWRERFLDFPMNELKIELSNFIRHKLGCNEVNKWQ